MKTLNDVLVESLLDNDDAGKNIKKEIKKFLKDNYTGAAGCKISKELNDDGKYVIDCDRSLFMKQSRCNLLTNDYFVFGEVDGDFACNGCDNLTSLEGAPKKVTKSFHCFDCKSLTSLEGAPENVGRHFDCSYCNNLTSLEGAPQNVGGDFHCFDCGKQFTEEDVKKISNVKHKIFV